MKTTRDELLELVDEMRGDGDVSSNYYEKLKELASRLPPYAPEEQQSVLREIGLPTIFEHCR